MNREKKSSRVMEVLHIENDLLYFDFFHEAAWKKIVHTFFIEGGLSFPEKINPLKDINELTEEDYQLFFEEIGYEVIAFSEYDTEKHIKNMVKIPNKTGEAKS